METQGTRLGSLQETGEQLIKDADYHNSTAMGIRDQLGDFDGCWADISKSVKERKEMVSKKTQTKLWMEIYSRILIWLVCRDLVSWKYRGQNYSL